MSDDTNYSGRDQDLLTRYERQAEAGNLSGALGNTRRQGLYSGRAADTLAALTRRGVDTSGLDIADFSGQFNPYDASNAISLISRNAGNRVRALGGDSDRARNRARVGLNQDVSGLSEQRGLEARQNAFNEDILPTYTSALDRLNELAGTNAISAEQEGYLRSKIAATNRTAASANLGRVSSALGLRGMSDSPAAAALASSVAQDYDIDLSNQLADMGFKVSEINREQARQDSAAAASLANLRINAENAYLSKDTEAVQNIGRDTAALIDALYSRDKTFDLMERQLDAAENESTADRIGQWVDIGKGVAQTAVGAYTGFGGGTPSGAVPGGTSGLETGSGYGGQGGWFR